MGQRQDALKSNEKMICIERLLLRTIYCTSCSSYKKLKERPFFLTWRDPANWVYFGNFHNFDGYYFPAGGGSSSQVDPKWRGADTREVWSEKTGKLS